MKFKKDSQVTKGIIFAGCSFTWGQGLYYYSNLPSLREPLPNHYFPELIKWPHLEFMKSKRFPRLVANHFNTFEMCQPFNGGAPFSVNGWWENAFSQNSDTFTEYVHTTPGPSKSILSMGPDKNHYEQLYDYQDFSHIIYQFTQWQRDTSFIKNEPHGHIFGTDEYNDWLIEHNWTHDDYVDAAKKKVIDDSIILLEKFRSNGIKVYVTVWPEELISYVKNNPWFDDKLIEFDYKGTHYSNIYEMMLYNKELLISTDYDNFEEPPQDHHPSLLCHQILAEHIIKKMENDYK